MSIVLFCIVVILTMLIFTNIIGRTKDIKANHDFYKYWKSKISISFNKFLKDKNVSNLCGFLFISVTPTFILAEFRKEDKNKEQRKNFIKKANKYNLISVFQVIFLIGFIDIIQDKNIYNSFHTIFNYILGFFGFIIIWLTLSRCFEIFYAFYKDSTEHLKSKSTRSNLMYYERIELAMKSYMELVLNYAIIYYVYAQYSFNNFCGSFGTKIDNILDAIYYSAVTITTLGYGDLHPCPNEMFIKIISIAEVFNGFILIIVSFTVYVAKSIEKDNKH